MSYHNDQATGIEQVFRDWNETGELSQEMAEMVDKQLDQFLEPRLEDIEGLAHQKPEKAYFQLVNITNFLSASSKQRPKIIRKLDKYIKRLRSTLKTVANNINADQFYLDVSLPMGITIGLSWNI